MSTLLENLEDSVRRLTLSDAVRKSVSQLFAILAEENKARMNYEAFIETRDFRIETIDLPDNGYGESWEVLTGGFVYADEDGDEIRVDVHINDFEDRRDEIKDALEEKLGEVEENIDDHENDIADHEDEIEELEGELADTPDDDVAGRQILLDEIERIRQSIALSEYSIEQFKRTSGAIEDSLYSLNRADFEYDDVMWNTLYQYAGRVDPDVAVRLGLAVVRVDDEEYLGLTGCGMDLSPKLFCYQALAIGAVSPDMTDKIRRLGPSYFKNVVTDDIFKEATTNLGIAEYMDAAEADLKARMAAFDEKISALGKAIRDGSVDKTLGGILGLALASQL